MPTLDFVETNLVSFALGFLVNYSYDKYKAKKQASDAYGLCGIHLRSNFFESYFTDDRIDVSCEITNQSSFHWHDIRVDVYSSIFINESPVAWAADDCDDPYFKRLSIDIPFIKSKSSQSVGIPYSVDMKEIPTRVVIDGITIADGIFNPLKFAPLLNDPATFVKFKVGSKVDDPHFPICLHETFFKTQMFSVLQNLFGDPTARYGGVIDYLVITGKARVSRRDVEFVKVVPVANVWISTKEGPLQYPHDLLFVNTAFCLDVDFVVRNRTLHTVESQTYVKHSKPHAEELKALLDKDQLGFSHSVLRIGDDVNNIEFILASIASDTPRKFKNVDTARPGQEIISPNIKVSF